VQTVALLQTPCFADLALHCASLPAFNHNRVQIVTSHFGCVDVAILQAPCFADLALLYPGLHSGLQQLLDYDGDVEATFCR
jgi:hypothetical protein